MAIPEIKKYRIPKFWDDSFKTLQYVNETFNDAKNLALWRSLGFADKFTGDMCDMRAAMPAWNSIFVAVFQGLGWKDVGTSYYRMRPGTILPTHADLYVRYVELFKLLGKESSIKRAVIFLEDWKSGHYAEYDGEPFVRWCAGDVVEWSYDTMHMAANLGFEPRYTLQITGHV